MSGTQRSLRKMNFLQVYDYASHYKGPIHYLIDKEIGGDFITGDLKTDVKEMDFTVLTCPVRKLHVITGKRWKYMKGMPGLIRKDYDTYLIGDEIRDISTWLFLIRKKLFHPRKRVFGWGHGMLGKENKIKQFLYRCFFGMMDGAFIYNERSTKLMAERGIPSRKLHTIYNSLNYDKQLPLRESLSLSSLYSSHFGNDNKNVVFIGRLTKVKRFDLLIEAIEILNKRGEFVNVTFIGDGVERSNLEKLVKEKGLEGQIWFYGACYDERKNAELIYNADICVSPGNIGLTAMHVLMFGCPAITNDDFDHQMPEYEAIQKGKSGDFFRAGDSQSLADTISAWLKEHGEDRERVRKNCYKEIDLKWNPHNQIRIFKKVILG